MNDIETLAQELIDHSIDDLKAGLSLQTSKAIFNKFWTIDYATFDKLAPMVLEKAKIFNNLRSNAFLHVTVGRIYLVKGNMALSMHYLETAERLMDGCTENALRLEILPDIYLTYHYFFFLQKRHVQSLVYIEKAITLINELSAPKELPMLQMLVRAYLDKAKVLILLNRIEEADQVLDLMEASLTSNKDISDYLYFFLYSERGNVCMAQGKYKEALRFFNDSEKTISDFYAVDRIIPHLLLNKANYYRKTKAYELAEQTYQETIKLFLDLEMKLDLISCYETLIDFYKELEDYKRAFEYQQKYHQLYIDGILKENDQLVQVLTYKNKVQQLEFETQQRQKLSKIKENFFLNITHDLRNTLSLIINPLQMALHKTDPAPKALSPYLNTALSNSHDLLNLSKQLLEISQMETDEQGQATQIAIYQQQVDWVSFLKANWEKFQNKALSKGIHYQFSSNTTQLIGNTDTEKLQRILHNLLSNAIKFTQEGERIELSMEFLPETQQLVIEVNDTGIGIPKADQAHIFDRFYQLEHSAQKGGVGLGLAIVKHLSELLNIHIELTSEPNAGSHFSLTLNPQIKQLPDKLAPISWQAMHTSIHQTATEVSTYKGKILLVEDHPDINQYVSQLLEAEQFQVISSDDPVKALNLVQLEQPQLIISDGKLPNMDGFEFCKTIKNHLPSSHIPIILLTALSGEHYTLKGIESGADVYLTKPFDQQELLLQIKRLLANQVQLSLHYQRQLLGESNEDTSIEKPSNTLDETFLEQLLDKIDTNLGSADLNTENLSKNMFMHRRTLYRKVKGLLNLSVNELIRKRRLMRARQLLQNPSTSIGEIATLVGFSCVSYFSKAFKKEFGVLPSKMQQINNEV